MKEKIMVARLTQMLLRLWSSSQIKMDLLLRNTKSLLRMDTFWVFTESQEHFLRHHNKAPWKKEFKTVNHQCSFNTVWNLTWCSGYSIDLLLPQHSCLQELATMSGWATIEAVDSVRPIKLLIPNPNSTGTSTGKTWAPKIPQPSSMLFSRRQVMSSSHTLVILRVPHKLWQVLLWCQNTTHRSSSSAHSWLHQQVWRTRVSPFFNLCQQGSIETSSLPRLILSASGIFFHTTSLTLVWLLSSVHSSMVKSVTSLWVSLQMKTQRLTILKDTMYTCPMSHQVLVSETFSTMLNWLTSTWRHSEDGTSKTPNWTRKLMDRILLQIMTSNF